MTKFFLRDLFFLFLLAVWQAGFGVEPLIAAILQPQRLTPTARGSSGH